MAIRGGALRHISGVPVTRVPRWLQSSLGGTGEPSGRALRGQKRAAGGPGCGPGWVTRTQSAHWLAAGPRFPRPPLPLALPAQRAPASEEEQRRARGRQGPGV